MLQNRILLRAGLRRPVDGYRHGAGLVLRQEAARFVLSAFGLKIWPNALLDIEGTKACLAARLSEFLSGEPESHVRIIRVSAQDRSERCDKPNYTLRFEDWISSPGRFIRPGQWNDDEPRKPDHTGEALLNFVCRISPAGYADLWMRVHHVGADGQPMQEMLSRLEADWGSEPINYPAPEEFESFEQPRLCDAGSHRGLAESQAFVDFGPLLAWRKNHNSRSQDQLTVAASILFRMARQDIWSTLHMATTVAVPEVSGLPRAVGMVVLRPSDYFHKPDGLSRYAREFNRQMDLTRRRVSPAFKNLDASAHISPALATRVLSYALEGGRAFGSIGLTMLRDARVFGVPLGDFGHTDGFLAIGNMDLPCSHGGRVGCVTFKGPMHRTRDYPRLFRQAITSLQH